MSDQVFIDFKTPFLPSPYLYELKVSLKRYTDGLGVKLDKSYLDRDDWTEEELLEEGLDPRPSIHYSATLPQRWLQQLEALLALPEGKKAGLQTIQLEGEVPYSPKDLSFMGLWLEELYQALVESNKEEAPLYLEFIFIEKNGQKAQSEVSISFETLNMSVKRNDGSKQVENNWSRIRNWMHFVFAGEEGQEAKGVIEPSKAGTYLRFASEGPYLEIGKDWILPDEVKVIWKQQVLPLIQA